MIATATSVRLLLALTLLVYGFLVAMSNRPGSRAIAVSLVGLAPLAVWVVAPQLMETGALGIPLAVRRPALLAGAVAIGLRYAAVRSQNRPARQRRALTAVSLIVLFAGLVVGSGNWLASAPALLPLAALWRVTPSEASAREAREQPPHQQDR